MLIGASIVVGLYLCIVVALFLEQRLLIFPAPRTQAPLPAGFEAVAYKTQDGLQLQAAYRRAAPNMPTVVFFHGNGDNWRRAAVATARLAEAGYGVLMPEYRGYPGSPGAPSEAGFYSDGRAAVGWLRGRGIDRADLVIAGHSIGSGTAVQMAIETQPAAVMLISPFTALPDVAAHHLPWLPARRLTRDRFDNLSKIARLKAPTLILHGTADRTIPFDQAERLAQAAQQADLISFEGFGHQLGFSDEAGDAEVRWLAKRLGDRSRGDDRSRSRE